MVRREWQCRGQRSFGPYRSVQVGSDANGQLALNAAFDEEVNPLYGNRGTRWDSRDFWIKRAYIRSIFG